VTNRTAKEAGSVRSFAASSPGDVHALVELSPHGVLVLDRVGRVRWANQAAIHLVGLTPTELLATEDLLRLQPASAEAPLTGERQVIRPDGRRIWLRFELHALPSGYAAAFLTDVTPEFRLEQEADASGAGLSQLVRSAPVAMATTDVAGRVVLWNPVCETLLDRSADMVAGSTLAGALGADADSVAALVTRASSGEGLNAVELDGHRSDGVRLQLRMTLGPIYDGDDVVGLVALLVDVTEQLAAEAARRAGERRLRKILENINDTVTLVDEGGNTVGGTGQLVAPAPILGYSPNFWTAANVFDLLHPADTEQAIDLMGRLLAAPGERVTAELRVRDSANSWNTVEGTGVNLLDDPDVGAILLTTRNISARKLAEASVHGQARVLRLVAQRAPLRDTLAEVGVLVEGLVPGARCGIITTGPLPASEPLTLGATDETLLRAVVEAVVGAEAAVPGDPTVVALADLPGLARRRAALQAAAWHTVWLYPIRRVGGERDDGALLCLFDAARKPSPADAELLAVAADLAAIAVEREDSERRLARLALHDELTGLANRHLLFNRLEQAVSRARRHGHQLAVMFLDLDRLKLINDTLGHEAGDIVLREFGERLRHLVRPADTVARFGGDEFVIVIEPVHSERDLAAVAERLERALEQPFSVNGNGELFVTASVGLTVTDGKGVKASDLLRDADTAMYRAKQQGRNRLEVFDATLRTQLVDRLRMENDLRRALERGELAVHFQPTVDLASGTVTAVEALLRWTHPELGPIEPAAFLQVAEETGLITELGMWALDRALADLAAIDTATVAPGLSLAVNLSPRQAAQPDLAAALVRILDRHGWPVQQLIVELTESALLRDAEVARTNLTALADLGASLAIDDFGTGSSSLASLHALPVRLVKIDRSFVAEVSSAGRRHAVVRAVIGMAHALDIAVVAEGVETDEQIDALRALGCDLGQGHAIAPPVSAADLAPILQRYGPSRREHDRRD
jgi:diguanylate cyclase (GGDEF)-like protein/PAS domain S-box-containing protein